MLTNAQTKRILLNRKMKRSSWLNKFWVKNVSCDESGNFVREKPCDQEYAYRVSNVEKDSVPDIRSQFGPHESWAPGTEAVLVKKVAHVCDTVLIIFQFLRFSFFFHVCSGPWGNLRLPVHNDNAAWLSLLWLSWWVILLPKIVWSQVDIKPTLPLRHSGVASDLILLIDFILSGANSALDRFVKRVLRRWHVEWLLVCHSFNYWFN